MSPSLSNSNWLIGPVALSICGSLIANLKDENRIFPKIGRMAEKHCSIHRCTLVRKRRFGISKFYLMSATPKVVAIQKRVKSVFEKFSDKFVIKMFCALPAKEQSLSPHFVEKYT